MTEDDDCEDIKLLKAAAKSLGEHFDNVQIFANRCDDRADCTRHVHSGYGNYFARYGQVEQWVDAQRALNATGAEDEEE